MSIIVEPVKIKETTYLLIPKNIVELTDIDKQTSFTLKIKLNGKNHILEYQIK